MILNIKSFEAIEKEKTTKKKRCSANLCVNSAQRCQRKQEMKRIKCFFASKRRKTYCQQLVTVT